MQIGMKMWVTDTFEAVLTFVSFTVSFSALKG